MIINMNGAKAPEPPSPELQEKTVTPETLPVVIGTDEGYDGLSQVTVNPDAQLKSENIKYGTTVFGVEGSYGKQFVEGIIDVDGSGTTTEQTFHFALDFSEYPTQLTFDYPADIPQGMLLDPTTVRCDRPDFLIPARVPEHLTWLGVTGTSPWHMFNTERGHKPTSFPYVITPAKEFRTMEDPINGSKWGRTFTLTYAEEVVNAPDNLTPENIKSGVNIAGVMGSYTGEGEPIVDPEAQFWMDLCTTNSNTNPANAPHGLLTRWPLAYSFSQKYIGAEGIDLSNVQITKQEYSFNNVNQYYYNGSEYVLGGDIVLPPDTELNAFSAFGQAYLKDIPVGLKNFRYFVNMTRFHKDKLVLSPDMIPNGILDFSISYISAFELQGKSIKYDKPITLVFPSTLTKISGSMSGSFSAAARFVFTSAEPPTLTSSSNISNFSAIVVPVGSLEAYQTATNWAEHAAKMVEGTE